MKKMLNGIFWTIFIAWNALLLFIILGKQEIRPSIQIKKNIQNSLQEVSNITIYENANAKYSFSDLEGKLIKVELKQYKNADGSNVMIFKNAFIKMGVLFNNRNILKKNIRWHVSKKNNEVRLACIENGITYIQKYTFDDEYGIKLDIDIKSSKMMSICPYIEMEKTITQEDQSFVFSGITTYGKDGLQNHFSDTSANLYQNADKSWASFNEKYWLILSCGHNKKINLQSGKKNKLILFASEQNNIYNTNLTYNFYIGPKNIRHLQRFSEKYSISMIENTFDYGWFFFLTKPFHHVLNFFIEFFHSAALALLFLTILLKLLTWPLTTSSHIATKKMQEIAPQISVIKERWKDDHVQMNLEIFALYKKHKINPLSGCLPSILQMLMLFPLYKVLSFCINLRDAPFLFWITDLSSKDPYSVFNLFGLLPFAVGDYFTIGIWPILMGLSMYFQQKLSTIADTQEQKIMQIALPVLFTWMMAGLPAGVIIYWTLTNVLTILQILWVSKKLI